MQKSEADNDIAKNKTIMTAIVSLAMEETDGELQESELELIAYLLKHNFDRIKIDTDHDDQIITLISEVLARK